MLYIITIVLEKETLKKDVQSKQGQDQNSIALLNSLFGSSKI